MISLLEIAFPNLDPTIVNIFGPFALRWYGLGYLLAFLAGYGVLKHAQKRGYFRVAEEDVSAMLMYVIIGVFVGGRLGYVLFYDDPIDMLRNPLRIIGREPDGTFTGLSGLSFHGGLLGVVLSGTLFAYVRGRRQYRALPLEERQSEGLQGVMRRVRQVWCDGFDAAVLGVPAGIFFVRCANFINGELYGRKVLGSDGNVVTDASDAPAWAMRFPTSDEGQTALRNYYRAQPGFQDLTQAEQLDLMHKKLSLPVDSDVWSKVSENVALRHPSQIYQALLEGLSVLVAMWLLRKKLPKRGMLGGCFLLAYAVFRIPAEFFRQPDEQFGQGGKLSSWGEVLDGLGMTQGQFLSTLMGLSGLLMVFLCSRSKNPLLKRTPEELQFRAIAMTPEAAGVPQKQRLKR